jgi:hypothetical protein
LQFYTLLSKSKKSLSNWHLILVVTLFLYGRDYRIS